MATPTATQGYNGNGLEDNRPLQKQINSQRTSAQASHAKRQSQRQDGAGTSPSPSGGTSANTHGFRVKCVQKYISRWLRSWK